MIIISTWFSKWGFVQLPPFSKQVWGLLVAIILAQWRMSIVSCESSPELENEPAGQSHHVCTSLLRGYEVFERRGKAILLPYGPKMGKAAFVLSTACSAKWTQHCGTAPALTATILRVFRLSLRLKTFSTSFSLSEHKTEIEYSSLLGEENAVEML